MKKLSDIFVVFSLFVMIGIACFITLTHTSADLVFQDRQTNLSIKEAKKLTGYDFNELTEIDYDVSAKVENYLLGDQKVSKLVVLNANNANKKEFNYIISPTEANIQDEEEDKEEQSENQVTLNDGSIGYYYIKDLGERLRFEKEGVSYGLYHIIQFEEPYGKDKMKNLAEEFVQ